MPLHAYWSPRYMVDIGPHIMPMRKFGLVREAVASAGLPVVFLAPEPADETALGRVHTPAYLQAIATGEPRALAESQKFPWSPALAESVRWTNGGCIAALNDALDHGVAANVASGFHHAHADHGEGFCTFNGLVVALASARARGRIRRGLIVDLDLHYGNGTAALLESRPDLHVLSLYGSYYKDNRAERDVTRERAADTANCRSVPIPAGADGAAYLALIQAELPAAIARARPDVLLYQAGADPYREDPYSPLDLGLDDLAARDRLVFETACASSLPIAWVLAGGYTPDVRQIVEAHLNTFRMACAVFAV